MTQNKTIKDPNPVIKYKTTDIELHNYGNTYIHYIYIKIYACIEAPCLEKGLWLQELLVKLALLRENSLNVSMHSITWQHIIGTDVTLP